MNLSFHSLLTSTLLLFPSSGRASAVVREFVLRARFFLLTRTLRVQHFLDGAGDVGGVAAEDEFEAVV